MAKTPKKSIRQIRSEYAKLKKAGVVPRLDSRSIKATPTIKRQINRFRAILSGEAAAVRTRKDVMKELKEVGYKITKPKGLPARVLIPKTPQQKIKVSGGKLQRITATSEFATHVTVPVKEHDLVAYLKSLEKTKLPRNQQIAFKFFGNGSRNFYDSYDLAIEDLIERYEAVADAVSGRSKDQAKIYQNLEFVTFHKSVQNRAKWTRENEAVRAARKQQKNREKQQKFRDRMREAERKKYQEAARKRAAKAFAKRKKK